jgi:hypothetical protein
LKLPPLYELPAKPYVRRHGPFGLTYDKYKEWVRDEFQFRCVYCLHREKWVKDGWRLFQLDHVIPQSVDPSKIDSYDNLVYCCGSCNWTKKARPLPDPCGMAYHGFYRFEPDGSVTALKDPASTYIEILGLDAPQLAAFRRGKFRIYRRIEDLLDLLGDDPDELDEHDVIEEIADLLGYPHDIPDLRRKLHKQSTKPGSEHQCYFARMERNEIPYIY